MYTDIEIFNYFSNDLLSSEIDLLKYELDFLLMQYLFNSFDLEVLNDFDIQKDIILAS